MSAGKVLVFALALSLTSAVSFAQNTSTDTVHSRLPGDGAVKGDTAPKPNPSGQKATDYHPKPTVKPAKEPPPLKKDQLPAKTK